MSDLAQRIAVACGLDPKRIRELHYHREDDGSEMLVVTHIIYDVDPSEALQEKRYRLTEIDDDQEVI